VRISRLLSRGNKLISLQAVVNKAQPILLRKSKISGRQNIAGARMKAEKTLTQRREGKPAFEGIGDGRLG